MKIQNKIFDFIKKVGKYIHVEDVFLFGSRARGDNTEESDWDLYFVATPRKHYNKTALEHLVTTEAAKLNIHYHAGSKWCLENMPGEWLDNIVKEGVKIEK